MKVLKFTLSGKQAMFKKPEVNSYYYFTYGQIHKPAILGILGAILGYSGYNSMKKGDVFPEYYDKLKELNISIRPNSPKGYFNKKITSFNNSVGYASQEQGGNLIVKEQWLEEPSWDIYLLEDCAEAEKAADMLKNHKCVYIPYLGKNDHIADIKAIQETEAAEAKDVTKLDCLFLKERFEPDVEDWDTPDPFKYEESLPFALSEETNMYELKSFIFTNTFLKAQQEEEKDKVFSVEEKNIVFY